MADPRPEGAGALPAASFADALPRPLAEPLARLRQSPLWSRAAIPAALVSALALALILWLTLMPTSRAPLYRQLPDADKAAVVSALSTAGFDVALDDTTGDVLLPRSDHARARMVLAGQGLPNSSPSGLELLTDVPLGTSRAIEGARLKYAEERELANSIESLQGVESARVLIARPQATPFVREQAPVKASVTLTLAPGRTLSEAQSRAILYLVASAVPGLSTDNVAVVDQTGRLLVDDSSGHLGADSDRLRMQTEMESRARQAILQLLGPVVGADNVAAQVAIDLEFAAHDAAEERFTPNDALRSEQYDRRTESAEPAPAIGIPGAVSNTVPSAATISATPQTPAANAPAGADAAPAPKVLAEKGTRNYEVGRSVEVTSRNGAHVRRLTAAVAVRADALGPAGARAKVLADIQALVEGAVGFDAQRGDRVTVSARSFQPVTVPETPVWQEPVVVESAKWLAVALVAVALIFFAFRPLLKRLGAAPAPALPAPEPQVIEAQPLPVDYSAKLAEARLLATTDTARATAVARRLLGAAEPAA